MSSTAHTLNAATFAAWNDYMQTSAHDRRRDRSTIYSAASTARALYAALEETETARERFTALLEVCANLRYLLDELDPITTEARERASREIDARAREVAAERDACASGEENSTGDGCVAC